MLILAEKQNYLWLYIVIAVVAIAIISILFFLILKKMNKKQYLTKIDSYLNEINIDNKSQLDSYISRLKNISKNNEDFVPIYEQISAQFEKLTSADRDKLILRQRGLKDRLVTESKLTKGLLDQFKSFESAIVQYKKEIARIQKDLESYFAEGDSLRIKLTELQKQYQQINSDMDKYSSNLDICNKELREYLSEIEMLFDVLDDNISAARYVEANKKVIKIEKMLVNVYGNIETIAQYCEMIETVIPNQLMDLENKSKDLEQKGYVVAHARVTDFINNTNEILLSCKNDFRHFCFGNFEDILFEIQNKMSEVHAHLDQEVMSKHELNEKYKIVDNKITYAESEFIKTKRQYATMQDFYKLPNEIHAKFNTFQGNATKLSDLRREFEGYKFVNAKHPASFLLQKVTNMDVLATTVLDEVDFLVKYFKNLKEFVEETFEKTNELAVNLTLAIGKVRKEKCKAVYYKYIEKVSQSLSVLKSINQLLTQKPIDVQTLYSEFSAVVSSSDELNNSILVELNNYQIVEKSIIFANPLRYGFKEVDEMLIDIENLFKEGNYKLAQDKLNYILNNYHPAAYDSFKE